MTHRDGTSGLGVTFQPVQNKRLQHQLGISQVPGAILFKGFKEFRIEAIGSLNGQGPVGALGGLCWFGSFGHNEQSLQGRRSLGKLCIRPCHAKVKMSAWVHCALWATPSCGPAAGLGGRGHGPLRRDRDGRRCGGPTSRNNGRVALPPFDVGGELQVAPPATEACGLCHGRQQPRCPRHISV